MRRAGFPWRLLVHSKNQAHHVRSRPYRPPNPIQGTSEERKAFRKRCQELHDEGLREGWTSEHVIPDTEFDELVVGKWLHIEQMDVGYWWMSIGGVTVHVSADCDGRPQIVTVHGPGDYANPVEGVRYELDWTGR